MSANGELSRSRHRNAVAVVTGADISRPTLEELTARITQLEARLEELESQANPQKTTLSRIGKLPPEIMSEVFLLAVPSPVLDARDRNCLENLTLVCRGWREVALATHRLWSGVSMKPSDTQYDKIIAWLSRSGKLPKTVAFTFPSSPLHPPCECSDGNTCYSTNSVLLRLLTEGPTLAHFRLECYSVQCFRNWNTALASTAAGTSPTQTRPWDQLNSFDLTFLQIDQAPWDEPVDPAQSAFHHLPAAPSLRLELPSMWAAFEDPQDAAVASLHIPPSILHNLTALEIRCEWWGTHIFDLLQHCAQLESLTINTNDTSPEHGPTPVGRLEALKRNPVVLLNLRILRLESIERADILKYMRTPGLRHLDLHWSGSVDPLPDRTSAAQIFEFIRASSLEGTLESLRISDLCTLVEELSLILINLWGLESLTLERVKVPGAWAMWQGFQLLAKSIQPDEPVLPHFKGRQYLPSLRKLELLEIPDGYRLEWIGLYLKERKEGIPCHVTVSYNRPTERHAIRQSNFLKALCLHGFGISQITVL